MIKISTNFHKNKWHRIWSILTGCVDDGQDIDSASSLNVDEVDGGSDQ